MEILKRKLRKINILFILFSVSALFPVHSPAQSKVIDAFKESYQKENTNDFKGGIAALTQVYQKDSYEINLRLGWLFYQAGQLQESVDYYERAIQLKPYAIEPKLGLAIPYSAMGKWNEIIDLYNKILETDKQNATANYRLGLIYYNQGKFEKADPYLDRVVNLYPFDYDFLLLFAWNKLKLQKVREARVLFEKALMYKPGDESAMEGFQLSK